METNTVSSHEKRPYRAVVAGFCASAASAMVLLFTHIVAKIVARGFDAAGLEALLANGLTELAGANLYLAVAFHFVVGIALALVYVKVRDRLPENSWEASFVFMAVPYLFSIFVLFPLTGGGMFGLEYGAGLLPGVGSAVLHAVYGVTMVGLYEKLGGFSQNLAAEPQHAPSRRASMKHASAGIVLGSAVGLTAAFCIYFLLDGGLRVAGLPYNFTIMTLVFFCSSMGLLIGFWTGAPARRITVHAQQ
jgi:hypothetical protein